MLLVILLYHILDLCHIMTELLHDMLDIIEGSLLFPDILGGLLMDLLLAAQTADQYRITDEIRYKEAGHQQQSQDQE